MEINQAVFVPTVLNQSLHEKNLQHICNLWQINHDGLESQKRLSERKKFLIEQIKNSIGREYLNLIFIKFQQQYFFVPTKIVTENAVPLGLQTRLNNHTTDGVKYKYIKVKLGWFGQKKVEYRFPDSWSGDSTVFFI